MRPKFDVAIVGAGLAGLSLAVRLAALPNPPSMILIDSREDYSLDHIWCHWGGSSHPFENCITHRWPKWTVGMANNFTTYEDSRQPYQRIPADRLYDEAHRLLGNSEKVLWKLGVEVSSIVSRSEEATVVCADGQEFDVGEVFDSRPLPHHFSGWSQRFYGLEVRLSGPLKNVDCAKLMDFQSAGPEGIRFFYVLPLGSNSVFVEDTWFVPAEKNPEFSDQLVFEYIEATYGDTVEAVTHRENGLIPMSRFPYGEPQKHVTLIGTRGGAVRASSGYAFTRIQLQSDALSASFMSGEIRLNLLRVLDYFDSIFLEVLSKYPERMPQYFELLFSRVSSVRLTRFMESRPTFFDLVAIMLSLPTWPFLMAAFRNFLTRPL